MRHPRLPALTLLSALLACRAGEPDPKAGGADGPGEDTDVDTDPGGGGDNAAPVMEPIADARIPLGQSFDIAVSAFDPDGDPLTFSGSGLPEGATVDPETGTLTWTPDEAQVGEHTGVTITAHDGQALAEVAFTLQVSTGGLTALSLPAMTDDRLAPDADAPDSADTTLHFSAARGEHEAGRLVIFADMGWSDVALDIPDLDGPGGTLPAASLDVRTVKLWWQGGTDHALTDDRILIPELLLKDDALVRTVGQDNEVRTRDGSWVDISAPDDIPGRVAVPIDELDIVDAEDFVPVDVQAGANKQLWLTLTVPDDQPPGVYSGDIAITAGGDPVAWVPLTVEVLPFDLPASPLTYSVYYRGELDEEWPDGSISSEYKSRAQLDAELESMAAHGITNPTVYQPPTDLLFEDVLEARQDAGMDGQPVYLVRGNAHYVGRSMSQLQAETSFAIATAQAWGATDVYFMGRDEGREDILTVQREPWEAVRALGGKTWTAGYRTTAWRGAGNFDLMGDIQDLLICSFRPSAQEAALWHAVGAEIFVYENPQGGLEYPELNRRNFGLMLWQEDYDGAMTYAFQDSFGTGWNDFDHVDKRDFNYAYPTTDGVIDTIQYEGFREAVDDIRYLAALEAAMDTADPVARAPVEAWLADLKATPLAQVDLDEVRDRMVGWTLHLRGDAAGVAPDLEIRDLQVHSLDRESGLVVTWTTPGRATSQLRFGPDADLGSETTVSPAPVRHHRVRLPDVDPDAPLYLQAASMDADGAVAASAVVLAVPGSAPGLVLTGATPADGATVSGDVTVEAQLDSPWASSAFVDVDGSLLAWFRFSEGDGAPARDASSWGRAASMASGAGPRTDGWSGDGLWLDGEGAYADAGDLGVPENGTATVEGWYRFDALSVDFGAPIGLFNGVYLHPVNDHLYFRSTNEWFRSSSHILQGAWHHIAVSWDGDASTAQLWVDGEPLPVNVQPPAEEVAGLDPFTIGRSFGTFAGTIDELRVWDRVLTDTEVQALVDARTTPLRVTLPPTTGPSTFTVYAVGVDDTVLSETRTITRE